MRALGGRRLAGRLLSLVLAAAAGACHARGLDLTHAGACPYRTAAAWQGFLDRAAGNPAWVRTCDDDGCDTATYKAVKADVAAVFAQCEGLLADNPPVAACTERLRRFTASWLPLHDKTSYGFCADNAAYFAAQVAPGTPPGMMDPPSALLSAMPELDRVIDAARAKGWPYVLQRSCLGNERLYVVVPDPSGKLDQWIVMNVRDPKAVPTLVHTRVSFLAVQKTDAAGAPLPAVRVHFRDLLVQSSPGGAYRVENDERDNAKCYACHPSGVRRLLAARTPDLAAKPVLGEPGYPGDGPSDFAVERLAAMNARLSSYGLNDYTGQIAVADQGPALGAEEGCTKCHDGKHRGVLTVSTSRKQIEHKLLTELAMPPAPGLSDLLERRATKAPPLTAAEAATLDEAEATHARLLAALTASRAPALQRWLLETRCE